MISTDEARLILGKWESESVWVYVLFGAGDELHKFWSKVKVLEDRLILAGTVALLSLSFAEVQTWSYGDPREAPPAIRSEMEAKFTCALSAGFSGFRFLVLYEGKS
jgi:hypothetical protein